MSQRTPSHCVGDRAERLDDGGPQVGREGVQLHDVRPGREVRVAAVREDAVADADERGRVALEVVVAAADEVLRDARPSTDGRARRGSARSRGSAPSPRSASAARAAARPSGPPRCASTRVVADAVRRADDVLGPRSRAARAGSSRPARRSRARSRSRPGCAPRRPSARPRRSRASAIASHSRSRHAGEVDRSSLAPAQLVEPDPGVDLVDEGMLDQMAHSLTACLRQRSRYFGLFQTIRERRVSDW